MVSIAAKAPKSLNVRLKNRLDSWTFFAFFVTALIGAPIITVIVMAFTDTSDIWQHLYNTVLGTYVQQTLLLMIGVGVGVTVIGTSTAWLVTMCRFQGLEYLNGLYCYLLLFLVMYWRLSSPISWNTQALSRCFCVTCLDGPVRGIIGSPKSDPTQCRDCSDTCALSLCLFVGPSRVSRTVGLRIRSGAHIG